MRPASRGQTSTSLKADVATFRAEARFLRALSYWHGIDLFGDVPLVTEDNALGSTPPLQATRTEVYNFIVSELTAIANDLPASTAANYGRATKLAAQMLLAHVYLNAGVYTGTTHYPEALAAASAVIAGPYSLDPSYRHLFLADNNTSAEIVFPITQDGLKTQTWGGMTFLVHASCGNTWGNTFNTRTRSRFALLISSITMRRASSRVGIPVSTLKIRTPLTPKSSRIPEPITNQQFSHSPRGSNPNGSHITRGPHCMETLYRSTARSSP